MAEVRITPAAEQQVPRGIIRDVTPPPNVSGIFKNIGDAALEIGGRIEKVKNQQNVEATTAAYLQARADELAEIQKLNDPEEAEARVANLDAMYRSFQESARNDIAKAAFIERTLNANLSAQAVGTRFVRDLYVGQINANFDNSVEFLETQIGTLSGEELRLQALSQREAYIESMLSIGGISRAEAEEKTDRAIGNLSIARVQYGLAERTPELRAALKNPTAFAAEYPEAADKYGTVLNSWEAEGRRLASENFSRVSSQLALAVAKAGDAYAIDKLSIDQYTETLDVQLDAARRAVSTPEQAARVENLAYDVGRLKAASSLAGLYREKGPRAIEEVNRAARAALARGDETNTEADLLTALGSEGIMQQVRNGVKEFGGVGRYAAATINVPWKDKVESVDDLSVNIASAQVIKDVWGIDASPLNEEDIKKGFDAFKTGNVQGAMQVGLMLQRIKEEAPEAATALAVETEKALKDEPRSLTSLFYEQLPTFADADPRVVSEFIQAAPLLEDADRLPSPTDMEPAFLKYAKAGNIFTGMYKQEDDVVDVARVFAAMEARKHQRLVTPKDMEVGMQLALGARRNTDGSITSRVQERNGAPFIVPSQLIDVDVDETLASLPEGTEAYNRLLRAARSGPPVVIGEETPEKLGDYLREETQVRFTSEGTAVFYSEQGVPLKDANGVPFEVDWNRVEWEKKVEHKDTKDVTNSNMLKRFLALP